jgi:Ca2+-transporting ATPase
VLGVAKGSWSADPLPKAQGDIEFSFLGLIAFYDPPAPEMKEVIQSFHKARVKVKMITGDYLETALAIARQIGIPTNHVLLGSEISEMNDSELSERVADTSIFARVSPEIKLRVVSALKEIGESVAMTGDGVNDAPALKAAHIGVAMGKRGTEVAKKTAGLVLSGDDLSKMVEAIYIGRRINANLIQAIRYIISIHIPIILLVTLPIFFQWLPAMLFAPIHVIFLELIMGPTCSIIYENEPLSSDELRDPSLLNRKTLLKPSELFITIAQGLMITLGCVGVGYYVAGLGMDEIQIRSYIFSTLIFSNIFLTLVNRSFSYSILRTIRRKNILVPVIIMISLVLLILILNIPGLNSLFQVTPLSFSALLIPVVVAMFVTLWIEPFKWGRVTITN